MKKWFQVGMETAFKALPIIFAFLLIGAVMFKLHGQGAIVFSLTANETEEGERLYLNMNQAKAMYDAYVEKIGAKYLNDNTNGISCCHSSGHERAIFSADFKHVLPFHEVQPSTRYSPGCITMSNTTGAIPATTFTNLDTTYAAVPGNVPSYVTIRKEK